MWESKALPIGVVGASGNDLSWSDLGPLTADRCYPAALYDPVRALAHRADEHSDRPLRVCRSVTKMGEHAGLRGAVVLSPGWGGLWAGCALCEAGLPVLWLAAWPAEEEWDFRGAGRDLLVPGLRLRYLPSTLRLRERIATDLGAVDSVTVTTNGPVWEAADWAGWAAGSPLTGGRDGDELFLRSGVGVRVNRSEQLRGELVCERGTVVWTPSSLVVNDRPETLSDDRPAVRVLLDLFTRRIAGGLVPVPSVEEVLDAVAATADLDD